MGNRVLADAEIVALLAERKVLPSNWQTRLRLLKPKPNEAHMRREMPIVGAVGTEFRIALRQSSINPLDFSCVLMYIDKDAAEFRLTRFNGRHSSQHTNHWEKARGQRDCVIRNVFHIHHATERYQIDGLKIDGYAVATAGYNSFDTALQAFVQTNGFVVEQDAPPDQMNMFEPTP